VYQTPVFEQLYSRDSIIEIQGNIQINSSTFINTQFIYTTRGSIINFSSCVDLSNSTLTVKISSDMSNETILLTRPSGCLLPFNEVIGQPVRNCAKTTVINLYYNTTAIWISYNLDESGCNEEANTWVTIFVAVVIAVVFISIVIIVCVYRNPKLRKSVLPYMGRKRYDQREQQTLESPYNTSSEDSPRVL